MPDGNDKRLIVTQRGSGARRPDRQRQSLAGLGLNKMHRRRELPDTPAVRGMIRKVWDLVEVEEVPAGGDKTP